jgi:predicted ester cyclase
MNTPVERFARYLQTIDTHDRHAICDAYTHDVQILAPGTKLQGRDAAAAWIEVFLHAFPDLNHEILATVQSGDAVAAEARFTATHTGPLASPGGDIPPTGKPVALDYYVDVTRFADGRIASEHVYFDQVAFLSQLGLPT